LSEDPIGFVGGDVNFYRYVGNSPVKYIDSLGLLRDPGGIFDDALKHPDSNSGTNDRGNAFQHCFASCMMAAENGSAVAASLGWAFEGVNNFNGQKSAGWAMDTINNAKGRQNATCVESNKWFNKEKSKKITASCATACKNSKLFYMEF